MGVFMCLCAYGVLMAIHYFIENYKEKGAFFIASSHEMSKFSKWQSMKFTSEVVISDDNKSAVYELKVDAESKDLDAKVSIKQEYPVQKFYDEGGYFHIRRAHD
eukprot:CAMPEP_0170461866 /NCGR_PEP_ID=MMETSP0123-20130129/7601_1 /TAXON_ID=182087 /ORGANISM="Favella ehrenbergii, Strain Fehren 1" /LENGTH=103 /DNA_ID=CAMNT_0010726973 /DNA_START=329 /DNA_END=640 /DNA_ORIENTATION=-